MSRLVKVEPNLFRDEKSKIYHVRKFVKGKKRSKSTGTTKVTLARRLKDQIIAEWSGLKTDERFSLRKQFTDLFDELLKLVEPPNRAPKTYQSIRNQIERHLRPYFDNYCRFVDEFDSEKWSHYVAFQKSKDPVRRLTHDRQVLIQSLNFARQKGIISLSWTAKNLKIPDHKREVGRFLEDWEIKALMENAPESLRVAILIAAMTGMRLREVIHLRWDEIDFENGCFNLAPLRIKTRKARRISFGKDVLSELESRKESSKSPFVFPKKDNPNEPMNWINRSWSRTQARAGIKARFHDLRHTWIKNAVDSGMNPFLISNYAGVSEEVMKRVYYKITQEDLDKLGTLFEGRFGS